MNRPAENTAATDDVPEQYVINLCASTTPMALVQPKEEALKRFTFFVSRRREDGRERFRLHMGYFTAPEEAEEWLPVVRELYPAAWVGEAPGKKLRAKAAAESAARAVQIAAVVPAPVPVATVAVVPAPVVPAPVAKIVAPLAPAAAPAPEPKRPPDTLSLSNVSDVMAQLDDVPAPTLYVPPPMVLPEHIPTVQPLAAVPAVVPTLKAVEPPPPRPAPPAPAPVAKAPTPPPAPKAAAPVAPPVARPSAPVIPPVATAPPKITVPPQVPVQSPAPPAAKVAVPAPIAAPAPAVPAPPNLSDSQVLRVLEDRREGAPGAGDSQSAVEREADAAIAVLRPDDTRTMRALRTEVQKNAAVQFAVQLDWSVSPIDISKVPPLAIFGAYTLYSVESSRDGRKWYGLRLGFFTDALSAKQVAYYVRSDFVSVAVVPVTAEEKDRAMDGAHSPNDIGKSRNEGKAAEEFKLFDLEEPAAKPAAAPAPPKPSVPGNATNSTSRGRGRAKPAPKRKVGNIEEQLEQTLEILGASDLEIDRGKGELLNDTGVRHLSVKIDKRTSTFSKLLDKLSDRMGNR